MRSWPYAGQVGGGCQDGQHPLALVGLGAGQGEAGRQALRVQPLKLGETSEPPAKKKPLVVPVASVSRPTAEGISAALSLGDSVVAVTVRLTDPEDEAAGLSFRGGWSSGTRTSR